MQLASAARQAVALAGQGRIDEAVRLLDAHADEGDGEALFARALWRIDGRFLSRDLAAAREDVRRAALAGNRDAARVHAGFLATGFGGSRDWPAAVEALQAFSDDPLSARQLELIREMQIDDAGDSLALPASETLCEAPHIFVARNFCTAAECALLAELAEARFRPALIFHDAQKKFVRDPVRDSDAAGFPIVLEWPFVHALNRRLAAATGTDVAQGETLQILRYGPGQQYRPHLDAIAGLANQRRLTALVYLNDDYEGGETLFLDADIRVKGRQGDALIFANALPDGRPDPASRHAGAPVRAGTKMIASRWIRDRPAAPGEAFGQHEAERAG